jgi:hypothetical protein
MFSRCLFVYRLITSSHLAMLRCLTIGGEVCNMASELQDQILPILRSMSHNILGSHCRTNGSPPRRIGTFLFLRMARSLVLNEGFQNYPQKVLLKGVEAEVICNRRRSGSGPGVIAFYSLAGSHPNIRRIRGNFRLSSPIT